MKSCLKSLKNVEYFKNACISYDMSQHMLKIVK